MMYTLLDFHLVIVQFIVELHIRTVIFIVTEVVFLYEKYIIDSKIMFCLSVHRSPAQGYSDQVILQAGILLADEPRWIS